MRAIVDQDITPSERLTDGLPSSWDVTIGIEKGGGALLDAVEGVEAVFVTSRIPLTREVIEHADDLEIIAKLGTGIDSVDLEAAAEHGITVTHTPGHNALSVAEHALCLALASARRLPTARSIIERGEWRDEYPLGTRLSQSTVGIVGFGDVGKRVASLLSGFNVELYASDPYVPSIDADFSGAELTSLEETVERSDFVIVTAELTEETTGLIGEAEFQRMKDDAILVNTARGPVVDEAALLDALKSGAIAGAGLDVYETEPLPSESPLLDFENVVTTPHIAAMTQASREDTIGQLAENVHHLVDDERVADRYIATSP